MHSNTWFIMFLSFIIILIGVSGTFGHTNEKQYGDGSLPQQWDSFVTFVNKKIDGMESLLKRKDDCADQLESALASQDTVIARLTQEMASLERASLQKDGHVYQLESALASQKFEVAQLSQGIISLKRASLQKDDRVDQLELSMASQKSEIAQLSLGIISLERASLQKDDRVDQLESALASQKSEIAKLTRGMASIERALIQKNVVDDRLVNKISELQNIVIEDSISSKRDQQSGKYIIDINKPNVENIDRSPSLNNKQHNVTHILGGLFRESELKRYTTSYSKSDIGNMTYTKPHAVKMSTHYSKGNRTWKTDKADVKDIRSNKKSQIRQRRVAPPIPSPKTTVAFHVTISGDTVAYTKDTIVVYGHETLDKGNGYNPVDGIYVTPETGTYVLTWTTICGKHNFFQTVLVVNGSIRGSSWTEATDVNDYHQTTAVVILILNQGDHVFIRMGHTFGQGTIVNYSTLGSSTFSGWKLD